MTSPAFDLHYGDCLDILPALTGRYDMILADMPYGTTRAEWDKPIDLAALWERISDTCEPETPIVLFASDPFTIELASSNLTNYRYRWVWEKPAAKGHLNARRRPMMAHEDILVFYQKQCAYFPQMTHGHERKVSKGNGDSTALYQSHSQPAGYDSTSRFPRTILRFSQGSQRKRRHPTEKPVKLLRYLIRTYTQPGQAVLDFCMGSGSAGVAALREGRSFIGIEIDEDFYRIASDRILSSGSSRPPITPDPLRQP